MIFGHTIQAMKGILNQIVVTLLIGHVWSNEILIVPFFNIYPPFHVTKSS